LSASALHLLIAASIAAAAAILFVALIRKPLRQLSGPQAACWIWLLVPACTLVAFLPVPSQVLRIASQISASTFALPLPAADAATATSYAAVALLVWLAGCVAMAAFMASRQREFVRSLRTMTLAPRIIVPTDFDVRYGPRERALMLAHEQAHLERGDILVGLVAMIWLCVFWFNPLMYWAVSRLRFDQELACDASVLSRLHAGRCQYARTLLKAQLATDSPWRIPISCHWLSAHPLQERIAMLKHASPGLARRSLGLLFISASIVAGSGIVWAAQPEPARVEVLQEGDLQFEFFADRIAELPNGVVAFSGNVSFALTHSGTWRLTYEADRITRIADAMLLEGAVRISLGRRILTTNQATVEKDGIVRMDAAPLSPVP
jgi:bla regulator protein blaR1